MYVDSIIADLEKKSVQEENPEDYMKDGLIHCGKCNTPKQHRVTLFGIEKIVGCICECRAKEIELQKKRDKIDEQILEINRMRLDGISDKGLRNCRFENAKETPLIKACISYSKHYREALDKNIGLLLWGSVDGGKTYAAACIANSFIDRRIPAIITSFPKIMAVSFEEREEFIKQVSKIPLLVIDDLGTERSTDYSLETLYTVIDERYKSELPLIITTNLHIKQIENPVDMEHKRIYSRILKMCTPIMAKPQNFRYKIARENMEKAKQIFVE